jgi:acetylornithine deacetylase/succinyl-diaminopimelate desuccinylase-like protein
MKPHTLPLLLLLGASVALSAQTSRTPDWTRLQDETMQHFQALLRFDTSNPPGNEKLATDYLKQVLDREGVPVEIFALDPNRPNLVARLKGNGTKRPLLLMGHTDVVTVDPQKWTFPPFSATRNGGYVYGRGSIDDKPHVVAGLMIMLELKRLNIPLDRDVIFLAEASEEGSTGDAQPVGIDFMVNHHFADIDSEYCLAEGGSVSRANGQVRYAAVGLQEKNPRSIELVAHGTASHGSVPQGNNAVVHLANAVAAIGKWRAPIRLNDTTREFFTRLAAVSKAEDAARYRAVIGSDAAKAQAADDYLFTHEPAYSSMLRTSLSPTMITGGFRINIIPSEAKATIDMRMLPDEDPSRFLEAVRTVVNNPAVDVSYGRRSTRPLGKSGDLNSEVMKAIESAVARHYDTATLPTMSNGASDMAQVRSKGVQCYGIGPATDSEDAPKGYGAHSDQERILETELHRFVRFEYDIVRQMAEAK